MQVETDKPPANISYTLKQTWEIIRSELKYLDHEVRINDQTDV